MTQTRSGEGAASVSLPLDPSLDSHNGEKHSMGQFGDEQEAARAFDAAVRRLRPQGEAHGGRSGTQWLRLNFPRAEEAAFCAAGDA